MGDNRKVSQGRSRTFAQSRATLIQRAQSKVFQARLIEQVREVTDPLREGGGSSARAAATPAPPPPEHPQGESGLTLSSEDMVGLHDMLQQCGLLAVAAQEEAEAAGTEGRRSP